MKSDEEYYKGFSPEEKAAFDQYEKEALETYDPVLVKQVNDKAKRWSKEKWDSLKWEGNELSKSLATLMGTPVDHPDVQQLLHGIMHIWRISIMRALKCIKDWHSSMLMIRDFERAMIRIVRVLPIT